MTIIDKLTIKIGADVNSAIAGIASVQTAMNRMDAQVGSAAASIRKTTGTIVKAMAAISIGGALVAAAGVAKATMVFADYEQAITNAASVTGLSGQAYLDAKDNIDALSKTLGETTVFSAAQTANAMYDLASAGYDVANMATSDLKPVLDLAAATQSNLTFATETVTAALGQFGLGMADSQRISDVMAKSIGSSKATLDKLSISMRTVGPVANAMGMEIEDVSAMLGVMYNAGMQGEQAATGLKTALAVLASPSNVVASAIEGLGLTLDDVNPATRDFTDILDTLRNSGATTADVFEIFGREGATAVTTLLANTDGIRELESTLRGAGGAAEEMADKQLATLQGALTLLKSAFEGLMIAVGEMAAPALAVFAGYLVDALPKIKEFITNGMEKLKTTIQDLSPTFESLKRIFTSTIGILGDLKDSFFGTEGSSEKFIDSINSLAESIAKVFAWIDAHPTITKLAATIALAAVAFAYIVPVVTAVAGAIAFITGAVASLSLVWATTTTTIGFVTGALALIGGPITLIIAAVALLAAAWATNLFGIRDKTATVFGWLKDAFNVVVVVVKSAIGIVTDIISTVPTPLLVLLGPVGLIVAAFRHWDDIKDIIGGVADAAKSPGKAFEKMKGMVTGAIDDIKGALLGFVEEHRQAFNIIGGLILTVATGGLWPLWKNNVGGIRDNTKAAWNAIIDATTKLSEMIAQAWADIMTFITDSLNAIVADITEFIAPFVELGKTLFTAFKTGVEFVYNATLKPAIDAYIAYISGVLDLGAKAKEWGTNLISSFISGIKSKIAYLNQTIKDLAASVEDYIGIFSPARKGPLSHLMQWGPNLTKSFADGIKGSMGAVNDAMHALQPGAISGNVSIGTSIPIIPALSARLNLIPTMPAVSGMNGGTNGTAGHGANHVYNTFQVTIRDPIVREEADIDKIVMQVDRKLAKIMSGATI